MWVYTGYTWESEYIVLYGMSVQPDHRENDNVSFNRRQSWNDLAVDVDAT